MHPFEAMAEPVRRRIVDVLASGEHTSGQLAEVIGVEFRISRTAVSKHLRVLRDAGFIEVRAEERFRWYRLTPNAIGILEGAVRDLRRKWKMRFGWHDDTDPLQHPIPRYRPVRRKGSGRPYRRGSRGRQTETPRATDPDQGPVRAF
jgi:DNA-binding transcriptional ArsR family regulator